MNVSDLKLSDLEDILWALEYAQPSVDASHDRPRDSIELSQCRDWSDDYRRFWSITQKLGFTYGAKP